MKDFKKLVQLVTARGYKNIPLLFFSKEVESSGKELELFLKTQKGEFDSDKDASQSIYGTPEPDHRYKMLKSRVKQKLLNHLYFLDYDDERVSDAERCEEECMRLYHFSKILINEGEFGIAEKLLNKCLNLAKESEFTRIILDCLDLLKVIHTENCRPIHFKKIKEDIESYLEQYKIEEEARDNYFYHRILLIKSGHSRKTNLEEVQQAIFKLKAAKDKYQTFPITDAYYQLNVLFLSLTGEFNRMIDFTDHYDRMFHEKKVNDKRFNHLANRYLNVYGHLKAKTYKLGIQKAEEFLPLFHRSSDLWFKLMEIYFMLSMHSKQYDLGGNIINKVFINSFYDSISGELKEKWKLYRSYLYFVDPNEILLRNFNYYEFITKIPKYRRENVGFNISLLILQFLNYLKEDKIGQLTIPLTELNNYHNKLSPDAFSKRGKTFLKLLNAVLNSGLDIKEVKLKTKYLSGKLVEMEFAPEDIPEFEVLPYEHLWEMILKYLKINQVKIEVQG
jgi:hypothetical protein